jgi:hypothetical protein
MATKKSSGTTERQETSKLTPRSLAIAERGINTGHQFSALMSAIMSDLLSGSVTPAIANASCNAGGKLLKMVELQMKYGQTQVEGGMKNLQLVPPAA